ncbi:MAG: hypothetical protein KDB86_09955 [Actinobacteria bacterium]|nr:hypothetical protein [Actinomycetota bacterium]
MCELTNIVTSSGISLYELYRLCENHLGEGCPSSLAKMLVSENSKSLAPEQLAASEVFKKCIDPKASHALVELSYFDADYRSLIAVNLARTHVAPVVATNRIVFLNVPGSDASEEYDRDPNGALSEVLRLVESAEVCGYMVLTPNPSAPIGRCLLGVPGRHPKLKNNAASVRTAVTESINVMGYQKTVAGCPFVQQDGQLLTCSHVAVWMVHYASVLRGRSARHLFGEFPASLSEVPDIDRQYPSSGLSLFHVTTLLRNFCLPPDREHLETMHSRIRKAEWYDRAFLHETTKRYREAYVEAFNTIGQTLDPGMSLAELPGTAACAEFTAAVRKSLKKADRAHSKAWLREVLSTSTCQYLNSGFPSILIVGDHARVIVGYVRAGELADSERTKFLSELEDREVVAFVCSDESRGPFELIRVDSLVENLVQQPDQVDLVTPLPLGLSVKGLDAQVLAAKVFEASIEDVSKRSDQKVCCDENDKWNFDKNIEWLRCELRQGDEGGVLTLRTYVVEGTEFKIGFANRCNDVVCVDHVRLADLPKYVWVVEVMDRKRRDMGLDSVVASVVVDATDARYPTERLDSPECLICHVNGAIQVGRPNFPGPWLVTGIKDDDEGRYMSSGWYDEMRLHDVDGPMRMARSKRAV